jgi:hypothetical protein
VKTTWHVLAKALTLDGRVRSATAPACWPNQIDRGRCHKACFIAKQLLGAAALPITFGQVGHDFTLQMTTASTNAVGELLIRAKIIGGT